jgi:hypothetical protein
VSCRDSATVKTIRDIDDGTIVRSTHPTRVILDVSADLHHKCVSAVCRRAPIDLRVGVFTAEVDDRGTYDVTYAWFQEIYMNHREANHQSVWCLFESKLLR